MRLINAKTLQMKEFIGDNIPPYYILSHRWTDDEITFKDFAKGRRKDSVGYKKVVDFCNFALHHHGRNRTILRRDDGGLPVHICDLECYVWVDTCCIDKRSSAELSEAINSMYSWYEQAELCIAYLFDVDLSLDGTRARPRASSSYDVDSRPDKGDFKTFLELQLSRSSWFIRGWTLQELLAPTLAVLVDAHWQTVGHSADDGRVPGVSSEYFDLLGPNLNATISQITGIKERYFIFRTLIRSASIACRMSWASRRTTTRPEDMAYCLLGIFGVNMPLLYGEGSKAFFRLQEEIIKRSTDMSIFAWRLPYETMRQSRSNTWIVSGVLAPTPYFFDGVADLDSETYSWGDIAITKREPWATRPYEISNAGLKLRAKVRKVKGKNVRRNRLIIYAARLNCNFETGPVDLAVIKDMSDGENGFGLSRLHSYLGVPLGPFHESFPLEMEYVEREMKLYVDAYGEITTSTKPVSSSSSSEEQSSYYNADMKNDIRLRKANHPQLFERNPEEANTN